MVRDFVGFSYAIFLEFHRGHVEFQEGLPFKLFDQLIGVLPPTRAHLLPEAYKGLMIDKNSKIADFFYPTEIDKDLDGKSCPWQDIELSFIEDERLLSETKKLEKELKDHEKVRNLETLDLLFVKRSSEASQQAVWCSGSRAASNKIKQHLGITGFRIEDQKWEHIYFTKCRILEGGWIWRY